MEWVTPAEVQRLSQELGLDAVGIARAEAYADTERHIRERKARGLFGDLRFTTARSKWTSAEGKSPLWPSMKPSRLCAPA